MFYRSVSYSCRTTYNKTYQHDEFHQTLATHEGADGKAFSPYHAICSSSESCSNELCAERDSNNANDVCPNHATIEQTQVGVQPRKREVKRQEQGADKIFDLFRDFDSKSTFVRTDQSSKKRAKNRMDTNDACKEG